VIKIVVELIESEVDSHGHHDDENVAIVPRKTLKQAQPLEGIEKDLENFVSSQTVARTGSPRKREAEKGCNQSDKGDVALFEL
jgi:hypothetical protein